MMADQSDSNRPPQLSQRKLELKQSGTALLMRSINTKQVGKPETMVNKPVTKDSKFIVPKLNLTQSFEENIHPNIQMRGSQSICKVEEEDDSLILAITELGGQVRNLIGKERRTRELENT